MRKRLPKNPKLEKWTDPFEAVAPPRNKSYQWIAVEVLSVPANIEQYRNAGWKPVPYARHAKQFKRHPNFKGRIVHDGLMLVERAKKKTDAALAVVRADAEASQREHLQEDYPWLSGLITWPTQSHKFVPEGEYDLPQDRDWQVQSPVAQTVEVTIRLGLSERQVDAATAIKITPQEYGQRAVMMVADRRMSGLLVPDRNDAIFTIMDHLPVRIVHETKEKN